MPKQILSVGYDFPGGVVEHVPLASTQSLLDADIIVFEPGLGPYSAESAYQGKDSLYDTDSFEVKERVQHWRGELQAALNIGKLLVVFMVKPEEVFVKTGRTDVSGTGRNARVTHYVEPLSSYAALPFGLKSAVAATGAGIVPTGDLKYLATLWQEFGSSFRYETYFDGAFTDLLLKTRSGDRLIGAALRRGKGAAVLLPPLHFDPDDLVKTDEKGIYDSGGARFDPVGKVVGASPTLEFRQACEQGGSQPSWRREERWGGPQGPGPPHRGVPFYCLLIFQITPVPGICTSGALAGLRNRLRGSDRPKSRTAPKSTR